MMANWARYAGLGLMGIIAGAGFAAYQVRSGGLGDDIRSGVWSSGRDVGTAQSDMRTRAVVALRGLLALPKTEARYFSATLDSSGRRLSGKCSYTVSGGALPARWWSITVYDPAGWLIVNHWNRHSIGSGAVAAATATAADIAAEVAAESGTETLSVPSRTQWAISISPEQPAGQAPLWVPTGTNGPFELTLRAYRPTGALADDPASVTMPVITRTECAA